MQKTIKKTFILAITLVAMLMLGCGFFAFANVGANGNVFAEQAIAAKQTESEQQGDAKQNLHNAHKDQSQTLVEDGSTDLNETATIFLSKNWKSDIVIEGGSGTAGDLSTVTEIYFITDNSTYTAADSGYTAYPVGAPSATDESTKNETVIAYVKGTIINIYCTASTIGFPQNCKYLFSHNTSSYRPKALTILDFGGVTIDTSSVTSMWCMFRECTSLSTLDVSKWITSIVTDMNSMFNNCSALSTLDVSKWDTSSVKNMYMMFSGCELLISLDVSDWDTSSVTDMSWMFNGCSALSTLDVSGWNTSSVTNMSWMFYGCSSLSTLGEYNVKFWNTTNVTNMNRMFQNCSKLTTMDVSTKQTTIGSDTYTAWDTASVANMEYMFSGCSSLTTLGEDNVKFWNTTNVTNMNRTFQNCSSLTRIYAASQQVTVNGQSYTAWDTGNVTSFSAIFEGCSSLIELNVSNWNTSKAGLYGVFSGCSSLVELDLTNWTIGESTNVTLMLNYCLKLVKLTTPGTVGKNINLSSDLSLTGTWYKVAEGVIDTTACTDITTDMKNVVLVKTYTVTLDNQSATTSGTTSVAVAYGLNMPAIQLPAKTGYTFGGYFAETNGAGKQYYNADGTSANTYDLTSNTTLYAKWTKIVNYFSGNWKSDIVIEGGSSTAGDLRTVTEIHFVTDNSTYIAADSGYTAYPVGAPSATDTSTKNETVIAYVKGTIINIYCTADTLNFPQNCQYLFSNSSSNYQLKALTTLDFGSVTIDTSSVKYMSYIFFGCTTLSTLDVSNWNTSSVTSMSSMFSGCTSLSVLDISNWDASSVTNMYCMFNGCSTLSTLDVSKWDTSSVTNMSGMFQSCSALSTLDINAWDTSSVTNMSYMFSGCSALSTLDVSNFDTSKIVGTNQSNYADGFRAMFYGCSKLTTLDVSTKQVTVNGKTHTAWDVSNALKMSEMFRNCSALSILDVSEWNTSSVTNMSSMFQSCSSLVELDLSGWVLNASLSVSSMFDNSAVSTIKTPSEFKNTNIKIALPNTGSINWYEYDSSGNRVNDTVHTTLNSTNVNKILSIKNPNIDVYLNKNWKSEIQINSGAAGNLSAVTAIYIVTSNDGLTGTQYNVGAYNSGETTKRNNVIAYVSGTVINIYCTASTIGLPQDSSCLFSNSTSSYQLKALTTLNFGSVIIDTSSVTNMSYMFSYCSSLSTLDVSKWDTSSVTNMGSMFFGCSSLSTLDVSNWDTSSVTTMYYMFRNCSSLSTLDVSNFDTSKIVGTNQSNYADGFRGMFQGCSKLTTLDVSTKQVTVNGKTYTAWDVSNALKMSEMFRDCSALSTLDVSKWDTSSVTDMSYMFNGCSALVELDLTNWTIGSSANVSNMFSGCSKLSIIKTPKEFKNANLTIALTGTWCEIDSTGAQVGDANHTTLNSTNTGKILKHNIYLSTNWKSAIKINSGTAGDLSTVTEIYFVTDNSTYIAAGSGYTAYPVGAPSATDTSTKNEDVIAYVKGTIINIYTTGTVLSFPQSCQYLFSNSNSSYRLTALTTLDFGNVIIDTRSVTNMGSMFEDCTKLSTVDVSKWETSCVTDIGSMFSDCTELTTLDVSGWYTNSVTNMYDVFYNCTKLSTLDVSRWNTNNVTDMRYMFQYCKTLSALDVSNFETGSVTSMRRMFDGCSSLRALDVSGWNTNNVTDMNYMFYNCSSLSTLDASNWDTSSVTDMSYMFYNCSSLVELDLSGWVINADLNASDMFKGSSISTIKTPNGFLGTNSIPLQSGAKWYEVDETGQKLSETVYTTLDSTNVDKKLSLIDPNAIYLHKNWKSEIQINSGTAGYLSAVTEIHFVTSNSGLTGAQYNIGALSQVHTGEKQNSVVAYVSGTVINIYCTQSVLDFPLDSSYLFSNSNSNYRLTALTTLDFGNVTIDTSSVTDMSYMFYHCTKLSTFDVNGWDTSSVTDMSYMFRNCSALSTLNLSGWDTKKVTTMRYMFQSCTSLSTLNLSGWDTSSVTNMAYMFDGCSSLVELNLTNWTISSSVTFSNMFRYCSKLSKIATPKSSRTISLTGNWYKATTAGVLDTSTKYTSISISNVVIYRGWTGTLDSATSVTVGYGLNMPTITPPTKTGYTFGGYFAEADGAGKQYYNADGSSANTWDVGGNATIYAYWIINDYKFTVTVVQNVQTQTTITIVANGVKKTISSSGTVEFDIPYNTTFTPTAKFAGVDGIYYNLVWSETMGTTTTGAGTDVSGSSSTMTENGLTAVLTLTEVHTFVLNHFVMDTAGVYSTTPTQTENKIAQAGVSLELESYKLVELEVENGIAYVYGTIDGQTNTTIVFADNSKVIDLYYKRFMHTLTLVAKDGIASVSGAGTYYYDQSVTISAVVEDGQVWASWGGYVSTTSQTYTFEMPTQSITMSAYTTATAYFHQDWQSVVSINGGAAGDLKDVTSITFTTDNSSLTDTSVYTAYDVGALHSAADAPFVQNTVIAYVKGTEITIYSSKPKLYFPQHSTSLFANLTNLINIDFGGANIDISDVIYMDNMFADCTSIKYLDLSGWSTGSVENMSGMFINCTNLQVLEGIDGFNTQNVTDLSNMFKNCHSIDGLSFSGWQLPKAIDMNSMFLKCETLESLDLSSIGTTSALASVKYMFAGCVNLTHLDIGNWDTTGVTDFTHMFGLKTTFDFTEQPSEDESAELASSASIQTLKEEASLSIKKQALFDAIDKIKKNGAKTTRSSFRELAQKTRLNSKGGFANNASNNGLKSLFGNLSNNNGFAKTLLNGIDKTSASTLQSMSQTITDSSSADLLSLAAPNTSVYTITPYWNVEELAQIFNDLLETAGITDYQFSAESKYLHFILFAALQSDQFLTDADMEAMMASMKVSEREGLLNSYPDVIDYLTSTCQSITGNTEKVVGNTYANVVKILNDIYDYNYDPYSVWSLFRVYSLMKSSGMPQEFVDLIANASDEELVATLRGMGADMVEGADSIVDINAIESETFGLLAIPIKFACDLVEIAYGIKIDPTSAIVHSRLLLVVMMSAQGALDQLPEGLFEMSDKDFVATLYGASNFNSLTEADKKDMVQKSFESKIMLDEYCFGPTMFTKSQLIRLVSLVCTGDENTLSPDDNYIYLKTMLAGEMGVLYTDEEIAQMSGAPVEELIAMDEQIKAEFETGTGPFYIKDGTEVEEDAGGEEEEEVFDAQGTYYLRYLDMTGWTIAADATTEGMIDGLTGLHVFKAPATCEQELGLAYEMVNLADLDEVHTTLSSSTNGTTLVHAAIYAPEAGVDVGSDWFVIAAGILTMIVVLGGIVYLKKKKFVC